MKIIKLPRTTFPKLAKLAETYSILIALRSTLTAQHVNKHLLNRFDSTHSGIKHSDTYRAAFP